MATQPMSNTVKRITRELQELSYSEYNFCKAKPYNADNLFHLEATLYPPITGPYYGNIYTLEMILPEEYPFKPPTVRFLTQIENAHVHPRSGRVCMDVLEKGWLPSLSIGDLLGRICGILY
jgi:ubiquitin-conjugating enzyme (huntingtin interacting protein 2)